MSGWKARIGYLSPSVFETPSDWDLILPKGFTIVSSGLNVQSHNEAEFDNAIDALGVGLGIFAAEECDVSHGGYHTGNPAWLRRRATGGCRIVAASWFAGEHGDERHRGGDETFRNP